MDMRWTILFGALCGACMPKVQVPVAAHPAVALTTRAVSVVASDRSCQGMADALVEELWTAGLVVDPRADLRIEVALCGDDVQVDLEQEVRQNDPAVHRRARVRARAHALVVVLDRGAVQAHLLGTGRHLAASDWDADARAPALGRAARTLATEDAALDLAQQLAPSTIHVDRRVWPNAPEGSLRGLTTRAVLAEQRGDLASAAAFAEAAYELRPNSRAAAYLTDIQRRRATTDLSD